MTMRTYAVHLVMATRQQNHREIQHAFEKFQSPQDSCPRRCSLAPHVMQ